MQADVETTKQAFPRPSDFATDERVQYEDDAGCYVFTNPEDGVRYEYDQERGAWFPMWNESLVAKQQSVYSAADEEHGADDAAQQRGAKRKDREASRKRENTSVYVSGLPADVTEYEVAEYFSQCGAIMPDILTNSPKVKLYRDEEGVLKGDALVTYYKAPSVQIAVDILDDSLFRASEPMRINVQQAEFRDREDRAAGEGCHTETDKPKRGRIDTGLVKKRLGRLEKKLDWAEHSSDVADRHKRTVILKHMFTVEELEEDVTLLLDLTEDVRAECEKLGTVASVKLFDISEEGVIAVKFKNEAVAKACVKTMNGRFFAGRQVEAGIYDGHTRYKSSSTTRSEPDDAGDTRDEGKRDVDERMEKYAQWLDSGHG